MSIAIAIVDLANPGRREELIKAFCGIGLEVFSCQGNDAKLYRCAGSSPEQCEPVDSPVAVNLILSHGGEFTRAKAWFKETGDVRILHFSQANGRATDEKLGPKLWRGLSASSSLRKDEVDALYSLAKTGTKADLTDKRWAWLFKENLSPNLDAFVLLLKAWTVLESSAKEAAVLRGCEEAEIDVVGSNLAVSYFGKILRQIAQEGFPEEPDKAGEYYVEALIRETKYGAPPLRLEADDKPTLRALLVGASSAEIGKETETAVQAPSARPAEDTKTLAQKLAGWSARLAEGTRGKK